MSFAMPLNKSFLREHVLQIFVFSGFQLNVESYFAITLVLHCYAL